MSIDSEQDVRDFTGEAQDLMRLVRREWVPLEEAGTGADVGLVDGSVEWVLSGRPGSPLLAALADRLRTDAATSSVTTVAPGDRGPVPTDSFGSDRRHLLVLDAPEQPATLGVDRSWVAAVVDAVGAAAADGARIWLATDVGSAPVDDLAPATLDLAWGIGRCLAAEQPEAFGGLVEVAVEEPAAAADALAAHLVSGSEEDEVRLEPSGTLAARLRASALQRGLGGPAISPDRLHVVSGGLLGVSHEVVRWLRDQGSERVLVLGSSPLDPERQRRLDALDADGGAVDYRVLDVGDPEQVAALREHLTAEGERLGGVFHLASRWTADGREAVGPVSALTADSLDIVLAPKADGALLLGDLARACDAEAVVLFSSAAATLGSPGQAAYAAANAVLDGAARRLNTGGLRAVSLAWGPIGEVGFGATPEGAALHEVWERLGILRLGVADVRAALDMALSQDEANVTVVAWDDEDGAALPWAAHRPLFEDLVGGEPTGVALAGLQGLVGEDRTRYVEETIRANLGRILARDPEDIPVDEPLVDLGVDSLIALEMLFVVEREFGVRLELAEILLGTRITVRSLGEALTAYLDASGSPA